MKKRIFLSVFLTALTVLLSCVMLIMGALHSYFTNVQLSQLRVETALASHAVTNEGIVYFDTLDDTMDCRITWIAADGTVLYDNRSATDTMVNHLEREEVRDALQLGYGESTRYSDTLLQRYIYSAERLPDSTVLRLSTTQSSILNLMLDMSWSLLLVVLLVTALSYYLAGRLSYSIVNPLNNLNLDSPLSNTRYEEISPLLRRLDSQQSQLQTQSQVLRQKQKEFLTVIQSLNEGLVLVSSSGTVLSINPAAARLLEVTPNCLGADFTVACRNEQINALMDRALTGQKSEQTVSLSSGKYLAAASPVKSGGNLSGVVLLLFDVTQKHEAEQLRKEFTANVSHELKTPLHTISGYAELMKGGLVPQEDIPRFSEKIYTEARRMARLVEDTLRLSRLDDGAADLQWTTLDLYETTREVVQELASLAELQKVSLHVEGENAQMRGIPQLVSGIVFNLTDNAIRYNKEGGSVSVKIQDLGSELQLTVSDTGIGIPQEHRERIFERFYRVDKSHSRAVGGTGLGLSIVKHAVQILGGTIALDSTVGCGTVIAVRFPK